jgi:hypothetical protein
MKLYFEEFKEKREVFPGDKIEIARWGVNEIGKYYTILDVAEDRVGSGNWCLKIYHHGEKAQFFNPCYVSKIISISRKELI